ncbi:MAG: Natural resistance-associated macrophage protein [Microgenomates group bacterium GW2011_GWA1_48_10]|nr:MAG: Natural resistance-associated macrophage protein [Microgenomates group bacterium GW2011_GWA1_48_10]
MMTKDQKQKLLDEVGDEIAATRGGPLKGPGINPVAGEGNPDAKVMFIGEAPGFNENEQRRPFVGQAAYLIFCLGILSISFLAIPVLAGASSYALSELNNWKEGLGKSFHQAPQFYVIMIISTLVGLLIPLVGIDPIRALFYTGVFYGVTAPILIFAILHVANNKKIMGKHTNSPISNFLGYLTFGLMAIAAIGAFVL